MLIVSSFMVNLALPILFGVVLSITLRLDVLNDRTADQFRRRFPHGNLNWNFQWL
jgi:hypothetical protein